MPISSTEIAQMNGAFQGMAMNQLAYAGMIGQGPYGAPQGTAGDRAMGSLVNRASAVGAPVMQGAMALAGLDPISLGLRAGMGAFSSGAGLGGAALAGTAVALPAAAGLAAAQYAGSHMMAGADQQMALNQALRSSFHFANGYGGQGFARSDMNSIGTTLRQMSEQFGPAGEITSFRELSQIAGRMGQMGLAQGVRDVQEFGRRFKETVHALKTMATDLGTTLEGALDFAAGAKQSGIFGMPRAAQFTSMVRGASVAGGLAVGEVTSAASLGAMIARGAGGLGRQGAIAGIRTIGQIGTATQLGLLSEEDIFNTTGLTGAEGRQAMATSALARTATWLRGGRGRRLLASIAGANGSLDEGAVDELVSGGMTIGETLRLDAKNLGKIGRANFLRNEGRLRGAALERFGGFLPALQLTEWARSRGIDVHDMDDRSMLFAQRQLGMGRDEVDEAVKMAAHLPELVEEMRQSQVHDRYTQRVGALRKTQGLEGIKQRFEHANQIVTGKLQKAGQDLFNQGSETIDRFFTQLFGVYVETHSKDIDSAYAAMLQGGASGASAGERAFGVGRGRLGLTATGNALGKAPAAPDLFSRMSAGSRRTLGESLGEEMGTPARLLFGGGAEALVEGGRHFLHGQSDLGRLASAGFDVSGVQGSADIEAKMRQIADVRRAASSFDVRQVRAGAESGEWIRQAYALDRIAGDGDVRMRSFERLLRAQSRSKDPAVASAAGALLAEWSRAPNQADRAMLMANLERGAGVRGGGALAARYALPEGGLGSMLLGQGGFATVGDENRSFAKAFGWDSHRGAGERALASFVGGQLFGQAMGLVGPAALLPLQKGGGIASSLAAHASRFGEDVVGRLTGSYEDEQRAGAFIKGERFRDAALGLLSPDRTSSGRAQEDIERQIAAMTGDKDRSVERSVLQDMLKSKIYADEHVKQGGTMTPEGEADLARRLGTSRARLASTLGAMAQIVDRRQRTDIAEEARRRRDVATGDLDKLSNLGVYDPTTNTLTRSKDAELRKVGRGASEYAALSVGALWRETTYGGTEASADQDRGLFQETLRDADRRAELLGGMSLAQKRAIAGALPGTDAGAEAARAAASQSRYNALAAPARGGGAKAALVRMLGAHLSKDELSRLDFTDEGATGAAQFLAGRAGIADKALIAEIQRAGQSGRAGRSGEAAEAIRRVLESPEFRTKEREKRQGEEEAQDPLMAAIRANTEKTAQALEGLPAKLRNALDGLKVEGGSKNPEDPK